MTTSDGVAAPVTDAEFAARMAPLGPFGAAPRLAAGVSGGPHSLALALLAEAWARARGGCLIALVVDHGLRPESAAEAAAAAAGLAARGIAARVITLGLAPGARLQERARAARLGALLAACAEAGAPWLLLGHHRADQAETLLFRALRGSGPAGLAAMPAARAAREAMILRPLLDLPPARLEAVVAAAGMAPARDPANADPRFARARLRAALGDPGGTGEAVAGLAAAAAGFARRRGGREAAVAARLAAAAEIRPEGFALIEAGALGGDAVAAAALAALVRLVGGAAYPPAEAAAAALLVRGGGTLGGARLLRPAAGARRWLLAREAAAIGPAVPARRGVVWDGRFRLVGPGDPDCVLAALGEVEAARLRRWCRSPLPAAVLRALPAIRRGDDDALVAVPALAYPGFLACAPFALAFAPAGGGLTEWACGGGPGGATAGPGPR